MKGKKIDSEFLSNFILECIGVNKTSSEDIAAEAKIRVSHIDEKIREVEALKIIRSKLLDVIGAFDKSNKTSNLDEIKILPFFKIQNPQICKFICDQVRNNPVKVDNLHNHGYVSSDILFCIKQLIEHKIIKKSGSFLLQDEMMGEYLKVVFCDEQSFGK